MLTLTPEHFVAAVAGRGWRHETRCGDGDMTWRIWGSGPVVVLLHGGYGSWQHWIRNVRDLAKSHTVVVPDLPGNGDSAMPPLPFTPGSLAEILADGLAKLPGPDGPLDVVGFSVGGIVAGHLAARLGERARTLVLNGPNGMGLAMPKTAPLRKVTGNMSEDTRKEAHRHNLGVLMLADPAKIDDLALFIHSATAEAARFDIRGIPQSTALLDVLPHVQARICGIWGGRDAFSGDAVEARRDVLARFQPALDFRILPDAGHWCAYEAPGAFNGALLEMLATRH